MRGSIIIITAAIILSSCGGGIKNGTASFRSEKDVSVSQIGGPLVVGVPIDLLAGDECLYVLAYTSDKWLHVYDKSTGDKVLEAVTVGRGPGEGMNIVSMDYRYDEHNLYMYDLVLRKTIVYHLDEDAGTVSFVKELHHPADGVIRNCHIMPDGLYLYEGYLPGYGKETRYTLYDGEKVLDSYAVYPGINNENDQRAFLLGVSKGDAAKGRFVAGTTFGAVLECFDVSDGKITPRATRIFDLPELENSGGVIKMTDGGKYGFSTLCLTDRLIYANYLNTPDPTVFNKLVSFDWHGKEQAMYTMDTNILCFCPDEKQDRTFYGIASSPEMEFSLVSFRLD